MTRVLGVDTRQNPRECEEAVPPMTANHGTEELHICAFGSSAKRIIDKRVIAARSSGWSLLIGAKVFLIYRIVGRASKRPSSMASTYNC